MTCGMKPKAVKGNECGPEAKKELSGSTVRQKKPVNIIEPFAC